MGAVEELFNRGSSMPLGGTLTGTMAEPGVPEPDFDFDLTRPAIPNIPTPPPVPTFDDSGVEVLLSEQRELRERGGGFVGRGLEIVGRPLKGIMDLLGNLDRPQQFVFGAITKGLETGSFTEGLESGFNAAVFRRPEPGGPKRRIEPSEVMDSVAWHVFGKRRFSESLNPAARFSVEMGTLFAVDPLLFVPAVWYSKVGRGIKDFSLAVKYADEARKTVNRGASIENVGHIMRSAKVEEELQKLGRRGGVHDITLGRISEDLADDELAMVRDFLTGHGIQGILGEELQRLLASGEVDPNNVGRVLEKITRRASEEDIDVLHETVNRLVSSYRNSSDTMMKYLVTGKVGGKKARKVATIEMLANGKEFNRELLIGQLVNRFGLAPTVAAQPKVLGVARRELGRQAKGRIDFLKSKGIEIKGGEPTFDLVDAWRELPQRVLFDAMAKKAGRNRRKLVEMEFKSDKELIKAAKLDPGEIESLKDLFLSRVSKAKEMQIGEVGDPQKFLQSAFKATGRKKIPATAWPAYKEAIRRTITQGPYVVDAIVSKRLADRFRAVGLTAKAGRELAELVAGIRDPGTMTDLPDMVSHYGVAKSLLDTDHRMTKDITMLGFMFDPHRVLPRSLFGRLKYSEDQMRSVGNAINDHLNELLTLRGKGINRGSEEAKQLALALTYSPTKKTGTFMGEKWKKALGMTSDEAYNLVKNDDEFYQVYGSMRLFFDGFAEALTRRGIKGFEKGAPIDGYFPILYPNLVKSVEEGVKMGILDANAAKSILSRSRKDRFGFMTPMEMDLFDGNSVFFRHMKERVLPEQLPGAAIDIIEGVNAYTQGALRKIYLEPAIVDANKMGAKLPRFRKKYLQILLKRLRGVEIGEEELVNNLVNTARETLGFAPTIRPGTRMALAITRNFYRGLLGGNLGFFLKNLSQGINTAAHTGPLNYLSGAAAFASNPVIDAKGTKLRDLIQSRNLLHDFKQIMERNEGFGKKWIVKMDDLLFHPAHLSETLNRGTAFSIGMTQEMKRLGYSSIREFGEAAPEAFQEAVRFSHAIANETQFIYGIMGRSPIAGTPLGRMGLQFFSWPVKQVEFFKGGLDDEGSTFMLRFMALSGMFSKIAEHAEVDAGSFAGFGFIPNQASPTYQALWHLGAGVESAVVEGDTESSRRHLAKLAEQMEYMVPMFLQMKKWTQATISAETGIQRGFRGRLARRTDDPFREQPLSGVLDVTVNPLMRAMSLPELSGEQAVKFAGLPSVRANRFRELTRKVVRESQKANAKARRYTDDYIQAYMRGDFTKAMRVQSQAFEDDIYLTPEVIKRELEAKTTGAIDRQIAGIRQGVRQRILEDLYDEAPDVARHLRGGTPLPVNPLEGTRP